VTIDAADVARRVARCKDVARLTGGLGGVGTPVIGDRWIEGVRVLDPGVEVHVVARWNFTVDGLTTQVRKTLASLAFPVDVIIDDIETPYDSPPDDPRPSSPADPELESTDSTLSGEVAVVPIVIAIMPVAETLAVIIESEPSPAAEPTDPSSVG
jgi:hypothetical protein